MTSHTTVRAHIPPTPQPTLARTHTLTHTQHKHTKRTHTCIPVHTHTRRRTGQAACMLTSRFPARPLRPWPGHLAASRDDRVATAHKSWMSACDGQRGGGFRSRPGCARGLLKVGGGSVRPAGPARLSAQVQGGQSLRICVAYYACNAGGAMKTEEHDCACTQIYCLFRQEAHSHARMRALHAHIPYIHTFGTVATCPTRCVRRPCCGSAVQQWTPTRACIQHVSACQGPTRPYDQNLPCSICLPSAIVRV